MELEQVVEDVAAAHTARSSGGSSTSPRARSASSQARPRTTTGEWSTCRQTSRLSSQPRSSACGRWSDRPAVSFRTCSHTSPAGSGGSVLGTSERRRQPRARRGRCWRSEEHTSELQSQSNLVCRLLLEKKKKK